MKLTISTNSPALAHIDANEAELASLRSVLTFRDRGTEFLISRHKRNRQWHNSDPSAWQTALDKLQKDLYRCLLLEVDGKPYTYAGLASSIVLAMPGTVVSNDVVYPEPNSIAWAKVPVHEPRYYQDEAKVALLAAKHGAIELATGSGKSRVVMELCHDLGHQAVIMAPTTSIARQLYTDFLRAFGKAKVGLYGDGKKELGKKFTIGIAASLTRVEEGTDAWNHFSKSIVCIVDESHTVAADTLERVCLGVLRTAPYRFFVSATQTRTDGGEVLLRGIIGQVVYEKTLEELVNEGFLAKPTWLMVKVPSTHHFHSSDALKMTQAHLLHSPLVLKKASLIIDFHAKAGRRVLVLIDEMLQFSKLLPLLTVEARLAHGGVTAANKGKLPEAYWKSDPAELVAAFEAGEFPVLVGTGVIGCGTDIRSPEVVVYLQGGVSAIQIPQALGRGTRRGFVYPDGHAKTAFQFVDFCPVIQNDNVDDTGNGSDRPWSLPYRHALARAKLCNNLYPNSLKWIN